MAERVIIGIDPDVKATAWAAIQGLKVLGVGIAKTKGGAIASVIRQQVPFFEMMLEKWKPDVVVVEGQYYDRRGGATPNSLIKLAQVAGGVAGQVMSMSGASTTIVTPMDWKGQTPKAINQTRTYSHFGILSALASSYAYPTGCKVAASIDGASKLNKGDWKHVGDALGLARYGSSELL